MRLADKIPFVEYMFKDLKSWSSSDGKTVQFVTSKGGVMRRGVKFSLQTEMVSARCAPPRPVSHRLVMQSQGHNLLSLSHSLITHTAHVSQGRDVCNLLRDYALEMVRSKT